MSVAENYAGKKRLIFHLRYINKHICTRKVKFDDWKCFRHFLNSGPKYMFKFNLKSEYHHIDVNENFQTYLGFSWKIEENSALFLFKKIVRPFVKYWHKHLIKISSFPDDGLSMSESFSEAICNSHFVLETLQKSGFVVNCEKLVWEPQEVMTWFGINFSY